jgi:hypothetical protein
MACALRARSEKPEARSEKRESEKARKRETWRNIVRLVLFVQIIGRDPELT